MRDAAARASATVSDRTRSRKRASASLRMDSRSSSRMTRHTSGSLRMLATPGLPPSMIAASGRAFAILARTALPRHGHSPSTRRGRAPDRCRIGSLGGPPADRGRGPGRGRGVRLVGFAVPRRPVRRRPVARDIRPAGRVARDRLPGRGTRRRPADPPLSAPGADAAARPRPGRGAARPRLQRPRASLLLALQGPVLAFVVAGAVALALVRRIAVRTYGPLRAAGLFLAAFVVRCRAGRARARAPPAPRETSRTTS